MAEYRLKKELEHHICYVNPKTFQVSDRVADQFNHETFDFQLPSFSKLQEMQQACSGNLLGIVDERALDMLILKNCLKSCSFFSIELADGVGSGTLKNPISEKISEQCFSDMTGQEGVPPSILAYVVRVIRSRL